MQQAKQKAKQTKAKKIPFNEALHVASYKAYWRMRALVEAEVQTNVHGHLPRVVRMDQPQRYEVGGHVFPWTTFMYGVKRKNKHHGRERRDRSFWASRGLLLPFDQLRRDLVHEYGWMLVMDPRNQVVFLCLNDQELDFTFDPDTEQFWIQHYRKMPETIELSSPDGQDRASIQIQVYPEILVVGDRPEVSRNSFNIVPFVTP